MKAICAANQRYALSGEAAKINGSAAIGTTDGDSDVLGIGGGLDIPFVQDTQPPDEIAAPVAARRAAMGGDGQGDSAARLHQFFGDLCAGRSGTDHQYCAGRKLGGVAIIGGVNLHDTSSFRHQIGHDRALEWAGRSHDIASVDWALRGFHMEPGPARITTQFCHLDPAADGGCNFGGISDEIIGDVFFAGKGFGVACEFHARKPIMPRRAVGDQTVPTPCAPTLGYAGTFQHQMRNGVAGQMFAHRDTGLTCADYQHFDFFDGHDVVLLPDPAGDVLREFEIWTLQMA